MNDSLDVSVIIINYKTPKMCCDCIHSLQEHSSGFSYEIIVIDNSSGDDSEKIIKDEFKDMVMYVQNDENLGTAKAFNEGAKLAKGHYLFYLNTDTLFINNAIYEMLSFMKQHKNVAVTGGNLYNTRKEPTHSYQRKYFGMKYFRKDASLIHMTFAKLFRKWNNYQFNYSNAPIPVDYVCAAATLMDKSVYLKLGGFDEEIFIYGDEALYAYRCKQIGLLSYNVPAAKIIHFEGDSFKKNAHDFSEGRVRRYYDGMTIHVRRIYGEDNILKYYKYRSKKFRKKKVIYSLFGKKQLAQNCENEIRIISEYDNKERERLCTMQS